MKGPVFALLFSLALWTGLLIVANISAKRLTGSRMARLLAPDKAIEARTALQGET